MHGFQEALHGFFEGIGAPAPGSVKMPPSVEVFPRKGVHVKVAFGTERELHFGIPVDDQCRKCLPWLKKAT